LQELVCYGFVKNPFVSKGVIVELQRLEFDARVAWNVFKVNRGKVGQPSFRANAREFWALVVNEIVLLRGRVGKSFENRSLTHE
jgi:hypothetical protein